ncbi:MAG: Virulence plasmid protein pGP6-D-related protein [Chlamydiales bacterium]|jgi:hypothetical protein|nr:Virulence plasmid protein pGP6-D-related protein [Chlamydiales bacterium]
MAKVNTLLEERFNKRSEQRSQKMAALVERSAAGDLNSFSGVFGSIELSASEKEVLRLLLERYTADGRGISESDWKALTTLTSEVKAINHQAALLHGERIKKAQGLLKNYQEGAFTAWLMATYGNRQTPYNFLLYYEFYQALPKNLHPQLETMPRQAIYTLASRQGEWEAKQQIVKDYKGQTKKELLDLIRSLFPLAEIDQRKGDPAEKSIKLLGDVVALMETQHKLISTKQKKILKELVDKIQELIL